MERVKCFKLMEKMNEGRLNEKNIYGMELDGVRWLEGLNNKETRISRSESRETDRSDFKEIMMG